jgi:hypothetical protein
MCRAYGCLPSDLPPRGTAERAFLETEWDEYVAEMNDRTPSETSNSPF